MKYYLMDLERSVLTGVVHYWKENRFGYTSNIDEAGLFEEETAKEISKNDFEGRTIMISRKVVENILK